MWGTAVLALFFSTFAFGQGGPCVALDPTCGYVAPEGVDVRSIPLGCDQKTNDSTKYPCPLILGQTYNDFFRHLKTTVNNQLLSEAKAAYEGQEIDWLTGIKTPVDAPTCMLSAGEGLAQATANGSTMNVPTSGNWRAESCGKFCLFDVTYNHSSWPFGSYAVGINPKPGKESCMRENSWFRGSFIQAKFYYKEGIFEVDHGNGILFDGGKPYTLTDFDGATPCGANAMDIIEITKEIRRTIDTLKSKFPDRYADDLQLCQYAYFCTGKNGEDDQYKINTICNEGLPAKLRNADGSPKTPPPGVCSFVAAQQDLVAMWTYFFSCEAHASAQKAFLKDQNPIQALKDEFSNSSDYESAGQQIADACDSNDERCASDHFNKWYSSRAYEAIKKYSNRYPLQADVPKLLVKYSQSGGK